MVPIKNLFLGIKTHPITMDETLALIENRIDKKIFTQHSVVNVSKIVYSQHDESLKNAINNSDIVNFDGMGTVWGARFLGVRVPERVTGIDLFFEIIKMSEKKKLPIFLLGASEEVLMKTIQNLKINFPNLIINGSQNGYYTDEIEVVKSIKSSESRLLFVAMPSPKKENFINQFQKQLEVDFVMGVGGTFDVTAGMIKRAPLWMQKCGLEWLFRLMQEPKKMWKRYLSTNVKYIFYVLKEKLSYKA